MKLVARYAPLLLAALLLVFLNGCGGGAPEKNAVTQENASVEDAAQSENASEEGQNASIGEVILPESDEPEEDFDIGDGTDVRVAALKGPTAMGLVKLMSDPDNAPIPGDNYQFTLAASPDEVTPLLIQGQLDIACVPANLAAVLYNRTDGQIVTLAVNTLGVLYIVERGNAVQSIEDLRGVTLVASGKGSTPEYALRYLLTQNGLNPDTDVTIDWKSEHSECVAALATGAATVALLPQPFVTVAQGNVEDLRVALDLTREWDALNNGSMLVTGVAAARYEFLQEHPDAVSRFLSNYEESVDWVNANVAEAAELIGEYDIVAAPVAEKALPYCNIVCLTGGELEGALAGYLAVLYDAAPESVGGKLPASDFYYGVE